ncbi:MAG TPA: hypothetical protein VIV60_12955 [Polyangiaceae bacterium]
MEQPIGDFTPTKRDGGAPSAEKSMNCDHSLVGVGRTGNRVRPVLRHMALSADTRPHFTTIASFVSKLEHEIASLFGDVLLYASALGLMGKEHFAVDRCKLPSNASKKWSGTHKELDEKRKKLERVAERMVLRPFRSVLVKRHRERDGQERNSADSTSDPEKAQYYRKKVAEIKAFLAKNEKKRGPTGNEQKSNLTDPESAKMTSSHGVVQGYNGLVVVDGHSHLRLGFVEGLPRKLSPFLAIGGTIRARWLTLAFAAQAAAG